MRVLCRHGHFAFYPATGEDLTRFQRLFKVALVAEQDFYTFSALQGLPRWSQTLRPFGLLPATVNYEGRNAWDVMLQNSFVYSLATETLIPAATVVQIISLPETLNAYLSPKPLLQPGVRLVDGSVLLGYSGELDLKMQRLYIYARELL